MKDWQAALALISFLAILLIIGPPIVGLTYNWWTKGHDDIFLDKTKRG